MTTTVTNLTDSEIAEREALRTELYEAIEPFSEYVDRFFNADGSMKIGDLRKPTSHDILHLGMCALKLKSYDKEHKVKGTIHEKACAMGMVGTSKGLMSL